MTRSPKRSLRGTLVVVAAVALLVAACTTDEQASDDTTAPGGAVPVLGTGEQGYEATIRRTPDGVPHILAETTSDLAFGQGWASGEDRTCDLADQILKIRGERAAWFGAGDDDANITSDLAWRSLDLLTRAESDWEDASDNVRQLMTAYVDGWNGHLAEVGADGIDDWCAGEDWVRALEPIEVYAYARAVALQASSGQLVDFIGTAQPPGAIVTDTQPGAAPVAEAAPASTGDLPWSEPIMASNGWAIGSERSEADGGMLVANPHFPWEGELRFWEVHLTIPGELNIYGVQLSGLPGIGIGFTEEFGWTHTVSAGSRFTAYRLGLAPGDATSYVYGDEIRPMTGTDITIDVLGDDGSTTQRTQTMWSTHYGPVIDFPGFGWSDAATITYRDANIDNDEFVEQYLSMMEAQSFDELVAAHEEHQGVPLFNTIAVSRDGRAWYADTSATPNLSDEAIALYEEAKATDPIVGIAAQSRAVLLDGSDPRFEWVDEPGARDPGLVPFDRMPMVERDDHVFNANDSFWLPNATEVLEGDYSPLHGDQATPRSPRTRENATILGDTTADGPAGDDGRFSLDELAAASLQNTGFTARELRTELVERCTAVAPVALPPLLDDDGAEILPAAQIDVTEACEVLDEWDGVYDLDRRGPAIWRETMAQVPSDETGSQGSLWATPFDPTQPVATPSGLAPAPVGAPDPMLERLARAVQILESQEISVDTPWGELQFADRNGTIVPIHGGDGRDGVTNVVGWGSGWSILDPTLADLERERPLAGSPLSTLDGRTGYPINNGTSFLLALAYGPDGPEAKALLTYGNTADRDDPAYVEATERFSRKDWRDVAFDESDVLASDGLVEQVVTG
jgi:acyl-homoserine-lactone acylase